MSYVAAVVGRLLRALIALTVLSGLLAGIPAGLVIFVGSPLPDHIPTLAEATEALTSPLSDATLINLLAVIAWALWLLFLRDVVVETILAAAEATDARQGRPRPQQRRPGSPVRLVAAVLVGAITAAIVLDIARSAISPSTAAESADAAARTPAIVVAATPEQSIQEPDVVAPRPVLAAQPASNLAAVVTGQPTWAPDAPGGIHPVAEGDNLWDIAATKLGDPHRWREIYVLNRGHQQANGHALTDPDELHVGWVLTLPARTPAAPPSPPDGAQIPPAPADPAQPGSSPGEQPSAGTPSATTPPSAAAPGAATPSAPPSSSPAGSTTPSTTPSPAAPGVTGDAASDGDQPGITLPSQSWICLGLAATIAAIATLLRLHQRRRARLAFPIPVRTGPTPTPVPDSLRTADTTGRRHLDTTGQPATVPAPIGVDGEGQPISLFDLPGAGIALHGPGAEPVARAILASALATGVTATLADRPIVVTTSNTLTRLLPPGVAPTGLDPHHESFDGERLVILTDNSAAVTHAEEEMIHRRRLLDTFGLDTMAALNDRVDHAEHQPPYVLLIESTDRYAARLQAVAAHRHALHLHPVILGATDAFTGYHLADDGRLTRQAGPDGTVPTSEGRLSTLTAQELVDVLDLVRAAAPRPETGDNDPADNGSRFASGIEPLGLMEVPTRSQNSPAPVRLQVLGPLSVATVAGPITVGVRKGSLAVLAVLAAHPKGRTQEEVAAALHPDAHPDAGLNRVRTDLNAARSLLRDNTAITGKGRFIVRDHGGSDRYRIDPDLIDVDLWRMLAAIDRANHIADDETACLAALEEAAGCYGGDFAEGHDRTWTIDYATTFRHQILSVYARIAELTETDQPDRAIAALEKAIDLDPVNEELYQRIMRVHGRQGRPDAVRRTLRLLEERLADLGEAEPSEATRRIATRQLHLSPARGGAR